MKRKKEVRNNRIKYNIILILSFILVLFVISLNKISNTRLDVKLGDISPSTIVATREMEDLVETEKLRKSIQDGIKAQYNIDKSVKLKIQSEIKEFIDLVIRVKEEEGQAEEKIKKIKKDENYDLDQEEIELLLGFTPKVLQGLQEKSLIILDEFMDDGIKKEELNNKKEEISRLIDDANYSKDIKKMTKKLTISKLRENNVYDQAETNRKRLEAADSVKPIMIKEGELIVYKGERIGEREIFLLKEMGMTKEEGGLSFGIYLGILILLIISIVTMSYYIYYFNKDILRDSRLLVILIIILTTILISMAMYEISPMLMPISMASLLIFLIVDARLAVIINLFVVVFLSLLLDLDLIISSTFIISGTLAVLIDIKQNQRYNILINGTIVGFVNLIFIVSLSFVKEVKLINGPMEGIYLIVNGVIAGVLALGTLPIWENVFKILTPLKLLELSNPNQPLLKKIMMEAPGTYHHSILVGNLAEAAAESIGGNALLARVGSYYHDLGKTVRPKFFAENQSGMTNPHDKLSPIESAKIITSHTKDGILLGKEGKLPKELLDMMDQHHGDTAVAYFYHKIKELDPNTELTIDDFRYKGMRPQTKEAAIIMLADSSEAAVRSLKEIDREKIESMVRKVVKGKIDDNQLSQCDISFGEIESIINSFVNTLMGIHHDRVEYPELEEK